MHVFALVYMLVYHASVYTHMPCYNAYTWQCHVTVHARLVRECMPGDCAYICMHVIQLYACMSCMCMNVHVCMHISVRMHVLCMCMHYYVTVYVRMHVYMHACIM